MSRCRLFRSGDHEWLELLSAFPSSVRDIYFHPRLYELYESYGDGVAFCFWFEDGGEQVLYPFLKNSIRELGYDVAESACDIQGAYGYNGIAATSPQPEFIDAFYREFQGYCAKDHVVAEFTRFHPLLKNHLLSQRHMRVLFDRQIVIIDLSGSTEEIIARFSPAAKRSIRKAKNQLLHCEVETDTNAFDEVFCQLYRETMERVGANSYLLFNRDYFRYLYENLPTVRFSVSDAGTVIAAAVCFGYGEHFHYHLGASRTDALHLRPNNLVFEQMVLFAKQKGYSQLHLGGGASRAKDDGLLRFKSSFSNRTDEFYIGKKIHNESVYDDLIRQWKSRVDEQHHFDNRLLRYREHLR